MRCSRDTPCKVLGNMNSLALRGFNTVDRVFFPVFKYLLEQYNMVYHVSVCSFLLLAENVPVLFSHKASSESNCNRNFQGRPAGQNRLIVVMCTSTRILNQFIGLYFNRVTPYTHFCIALYSQFSYKLESLLLRVLFFI